MQDLITFLNHHMTETYALAVILVLVMIVEYFRLKRNNFTIDVTKAVFLINRENAAVIDLRSKETYLKGHILDAHVLNAREMEDNPKKLEKFRTKPLILVCATGMDSQKVAASWTKKGYNVYSLSGGIRSWTDAGLPIIKE